MNQLDQSESSETVPTQPKPKPKISQLKSSETLFSFLNGDTLAQTGADVLVYNQMLSILRQMTSIEADRRPTTKEVLLQLLRLERLFAGSTAAV